MSILLMGAGPIRSLLLLNCAIKFSKYTFCFMITVAADGR